MFITFEGIEGCGKTTQVTRLTEKLSDKGIPIVVTREPGGTEIGEQIREMLLSSKNNTISPLTELLLYAADRTQHVEQLIKPALDKGDWVVCDRFFDATTAYQGAGRNLNPELIKELNIKASYGIIPDITFLLDCPVDIGIRRALERNKNLEKNDQDRFDREKIEFHQEVRRGYLRIAHHEKKRFKIIDATMDEDTVEKEIWNILKPFIKTECNRPIYGK